MIQHTNTIAAFARNTGRTTRMLLRAIEVASEGKQVLVVGATRAHAAQLDELTLHLACEIMMRQISPLCSALCSVTQNFKGLITVGSGTISFTYMDSRAAKRGFSRERQIFYDHFAPESKHGDIIREYAKSVAGYPDA